MLIGHEYRDPNSPEAVREADEIRGRYISGFVEIEEQVGLLISGYFQQRLDAGSQVFRREFLEPLSSSRMVEVVQAMAKEVGVDVKDWAALARATNVDRGYFAHFPLWVVGVDPKQYVFGYLRLTKKENHGPLLAQEDLDEQFQRLGDCYRRTIETAHQLLSHSPESR